MDERRYPLEEELIGDDDTGDCLTDSLSVLTDSVVGHKIVSIHMTDQPVDPTGIRWDWSGEVVIITLDNGKRVRIVGTSDCCAYSEIETFLLHPELIDHAIMRVGTTDGFTKWHIYADLGDIVELMVGWSGSNGYYGYGFDILVEDVQEGE